jgi:hypothetical protein
MTARWITSLLVALFVVPSIFSVSWSQCAPDEAVMAYCRLDSTGTRLGGVSAKPYFDLVVWEEQPGWDQAKR